MAKYKSKIKDNKKYDVKTGNELTLSDLGISEDEFKNIMCILF